MKRILFVALLLCSFAATSMAQDELTTFILIRHAEKADDGTNNPGLTTEGEERADRLMALLADTDVAAIYSTPFKRTMNTVSPLASAKGLDIQEYNPRGQEFIKTMLKDNPGKTIVVSGHSNTTPVVANILLGHKKFENLTEDEYGKIFIVTISEIGKGTVTMMSY
jgi:broad specificity phosphatase PhoE